MIRPVGVQAFTCMGMVDMNGTPVVLLVLDGENYILPIVSARMVAEKVGDQADLAEAQAAGRAAAISPTSGLA